VDLRALLRRLRLRPPTQLALPAHTPHRTLTFDAYLVQLQRQGYLDRTRIGGVGGTSQKRGRGRAGGTTQQGGGGGEDNDVAWEWRWGPRAAAEIGEAAVAQFVAEFMAERASRRGGADAGGAEGGSGAATGAGGDGEGSDEEGGGHRGRAQREEAQKRLAALLKGVERSAGGDLSGVTV
jgi:melanoma-associated antigen